MKPVVTIPPEGSVTEKPPVVVVVPPEEVVPLPDTEGGGGGVGIEGGGTNAEEIEVIPGGGGAGVEHIGDGAGTISMVVTPSGLNLPFSSLSTTSRELLSQFPTCTG